MPASETHRLEIIQEKIDETLELSDTAREVQWTAERRDRRKPVDLVQVVADQVAALRETHPDVLIDTDLPDEAWVRADELLGRAVENLLENAVEHNDSAEPTVRVSMSDGGARRNGMIELSVADDGPGIPSTEQELRVEDEEDPIEHSSGLGLWLVKWLVEWYGWTLTFEPNNPRGTVVRVRLPRIRGPVVGRFDR